MKVNELIEILKDFEQDAYVQYIFLDSKGRAYPAKDIEDSMISFNAKIVINQIPKEERYRCPPEYQNGHLTIKNLQFRLPIDES